MAIHDSILDTIGNTPIVRLHRIAPGHVALYAKVESFNPGGSVKDRLALAIVLDAERKGLLKPGDTIVEATSGNTGVALAMVCAARGYNFVAVMSDSFSMERRKLMRAYGAKLILPPAADRGSGRTAATASRHVATIRGPTRGSRSSIAIMSGTSSASLLRVASSWIRSLMAMAKPVNAGCTHRG